MGDSYRLVFPLVSCFASLLSRSIVQRFSPPSRSETNSTFAPSGLKRGCASNAMPVVNATAWPPSMGRV
jgi:hypothetical protein